MILGFRDRRTAQFWDGRRVKAFSGFDRAAQLKMDRLEAAMSLQELFEVPGNRFEALKGARSGEYSIRIHDQWRICFRWKKGDSGPTDVEIVDYH